MARSDGSDITLSKRQRLYDLQPELTRDYPLALPRGTLLFRCVACRQIYPLNHFGRNTQRRYGIRAQCRRCRRTERDPTRTAPDPAMTDKKCRACARRRPVEAFHRNRRGADGYARMCRACTNQRRQARAQARHHDQVVRRRYEQTLRLCGQLGIDYPGHDIKQCPYCARVQPIDEFANDWTRADRKHTACRDCRAAD